MHADTASRLDADILEFMDACLQKEHPKSYLIAVLHKIQQRYGYLCQSHMDQVAQHMQIPTAIISGVSTFYHFFRLQPRGKYSISICLGTACFVKGADKVLDAFRTELGIELGETTPDGLFSLESSRCLGVCALAPVVTINDKVYSKVNAKQVPELINTVKTEERV
ncbi:NAD(P)H-dependent oxidoreductase subunit E [candidate division KSB1 bacterium]|nr:NAD(P)H-dependent oxidoreductase subunit E [candidate division KSB1 bacterium]